MEKAHNHTVAPLIFRDPPTACAGLAQRQDRSSSLRCGRSVLTPVLTRRCLPGGRKPAKPLVDNVLTEPRLFRDDITKSSGEIFSGSTTRDWKYQKADFRVCKVPGCGLWARRTVVKGQVYSACPRHDRRDAETLTAAQIAAGMSRRHENHREPRRADTAYRRGQRAQAQRLVAAGWDADTYREWLNGQQFPSTAAA